MSVETYDNGSADIFCETLVRIDRIGSCRRLVFVVTDFNGSGRGLGIKSVVAKIVIPAEAMSEIAARIAGDRPDPISAFARLTDYVVAH